MSFDKSTVHRAFGQKLNQRIQALRHALNELDADAQSDAKSTAGDKHETARAMRQIEQARLGRQLHEATAMARSLEALASPPPSRGIGPGSLVRTDRGWFYVSVALGSLTIEGLIVIALSLQSPLGAMLSRQSPGATFTFNGTAYTVLEVVG
jgi:transcription elongation GreA/GreB family factor